VSRKLNVEHDPELHRRSCLYIPTYIRSSVSTISGRTFLELQPYATAILIGSGPWGTKLRDMHIHVPASARCELFYDYRGPLTRPSHRVIEIQGAPATSARKLLNIA
jgi:hypothetical protein